jgi:hypothetical protein
MAQDLRVPMDPILAAFGVPATVIRPAPDDAPIETTLVWTAPFQADVPGGSAFQRTDPQRFASFDATLVPLLRRDTRVQAPELLGGTVRHWRVDGIDRVEADLVVVVMVADEDAE